MRDTASGQTRPTRGLSASLRRQARGHSSRTAAAGLAVVALAVAALASPARVAAEPRTVVGVRFAGLDASGFGVDLEAERVGASSWLIGLSLEPAGVYAGLRRYTLASGDRPFYGAYFSLTGERLGYRLGAWFAGGYEVRFDPQVRGTGELGFGLQARPDGGLRPALFISLSLGLKR